MTDRWPFKLRLYLREVYLVTEYRDGCVYRTKKLGLVVCDTEQLPFTDPNVQLVNRR